MTRSRSSRPARSSGAPRRPRRARALRHAALLAAGPLLAALVWAIAGAALPEAAARLLALVAWMALWWIAEVVPLGVTALLPLVALPALGLGSERAVAARYADPLIFLFLGGFLLAEGVARHGLHRRLALALVARAGARPARLVGGTMLATALLSMWISNTAAAVAMFTVASSLLAGVGERLEPAARRRFGVALLLGLAYGASIGGLATLVGTPPNALLAAWLRESYGVEVSFRRWLGIGLPLAALLLPLAWLWITRIALPLRGAELDEAEVARLLAAERAALGPLRAAERRVAVVFGLTALAWLLRPTLAAALGVPVSDAGVAVLAAFTLFALPAGDGSGRLLDADALRRIPWEVLLLVGGGLALAGAFGPSGLDVALADLVLAAGGGTLPPLALVALLALVVIALGEFASNTASAAALLPVAGAVSVALDLDPLLLAAVVALAASANFAMPVATPPNAIVFGWKELRVRDMVGVGLGVDLIAWLLIALLTPLLVGS